MGWSMGKGRLVLKLVNDWVGDVDEACFAAGTVAREESFK
jgi:hypothetical protein